MMKLAILLFVLFSASALFADETWTEPLGGADLVAALDASAGVVESASLDGATGLRWKPNAGETALLALKPDSPQFARLRYFDRLEFDFRIVSGEIAGLECRSLGNVSGPRQAKVHEWGLAVRTTPHGVWHRRVLDFQRPDWMEFDNPDGFGASHFLQLSVTALAPDTVIEIRNLRLVRNAILLKPFFELPVTWPIKTEAADGSATYTMQYAVQNACGKPSVISAALVSQHQKFKVSIEPASLPLKFGEVGTFTLKATISAADIAAAPELYAEPLRVSFASDAAPDATWDAESFLVRPLSKSVKSQVILSEEELKQLRVHLQTFPLEPARKIADQLLAVRFDHIPGSHQHPAGAGALMPDYTLGTAMPEIVSNKTGLREFGTATADLYWKGYLANNGNGASSWLTTYLATGDEKYAKKAVELFTLYGQQYSELEFSNAFEPRWTRGPASLCASRVAGSSTYGTNWLFKSPIELLSAVSQSPAWTPEARKGVYEGFAIPLATELAKFPGGISNMTDISNRCMLLLGLIFDDSTMVHRATMTDSGLIARLRDIDSDGFSSEGRPLNYHTASLLEYLPAMIYLKNAGINVEIPREKLLAAIRMPYQRATLWGRVPNTGDNGSGFVVSISPPSDYLATLCPEETWLNAICWNQSLSRQIKIASDPAAAPAANGWKQLLETKPRLFPEAGFAILRTGDTPENQIMVTFDYGRSLFHSSLDRNQVTLCAFGKVFSHGPGTLYNANTNAKPQPDERLRSFCRSWSLGHNVLLIDGANQVPAVGKMLAWRDAADDQMVAAQVDGLAPGVSHTRSIALRNGVVVIVDRMQSDREHTYDLPWHNFGTFTPGEGWAATPAEPLATTGGYENIVDFRRLKGSGVFNGSWDLTDQVLEDAKEREKVGLSCWVVTGGEAELYSGNTGLNNPNVNAIADAAPTVFCRVRGKQAEVVTVLEPWRKQSRIAGVSRTDGGVEIRFTEGPSAKININAMFPPTAP